ncbi:MAG: hypothetical protein ACJ74G_00075 [Blastocatellia bacterium]
MKNRLWPIFFLVVVAAFALSVRADDKAPQLSATEIISKHLTASGGKEALAKFKSRVAIGTVQKENAAAVPFAIVSEAPNRMAAVFQFQEPAQWQLGYDGGKAVFHPQFGRATASIEDKYREMLATGTMFNSISLYNILLQPDGAGIKFEAKGVKKVKDRPAYVVEARRGKELNVKLYFDTETFMWVRTDYGRVTVTKPMSTFTNDVTSKDEESTYDLYVETLDFKDVDGVKLPHRIEIMTTRPILQQKDRGVIVATISKYRHNVAIDPKMYQ